MSSLHLMVVLELKYHIHERIPEAFMNGLEYNDAANLASNVGRTYTIQAA